MPDNDLKTRRMTKNIPINKDLGIATPHVWYTHTPKLIENIGVVTPPKYPK